MDGVTGGRKGNAPSLEESSLSPRVIDNAVVSTDIEYASVSQFTDESKELPVPVIESAIEFATVSLGRCSCCCWCEKFIFSSSGAIAS